MTLAVTDACIFLDLMDLQLTSEFFGLSLDMHTTLDVYNELCPEQQELLKAYRSLGRLHIHNITSEERTTIRNSNLPTALSNSEKTVIFHAVNRDAVIISNSVGVRNISTAKTIKCYGILWIFDRFIENRMLTILDAIKKIELLIELNSFYQNNSFLAIEFEKKKVAWNSREVI